MLAFRPSVGQFGFWGLQWCKLSGGGISPRISDCRTAPHYPHYELVAGGGTVLFLLASVRYISLQIYFPADAGNNIPPPLLLLLSVQVRWQWGLLLAWCGLGCTSIICDDHFADVSKLFSVSVFCFIDCHPAVGSAAGMVWLREVGRRRNITNDI